MIRTLLGSAVLAGGAVAAWSLAEARAFTATNHTVKVLPPGEAPLRILNISDLHLMEWDRPKIRFVRSLAHLAPDAVFLTGDQLSSTSALPALQEALEPLTGIPGAFVYGSHDYDAPVWKNPLGYIFPSLATEGKEAAALPHREMAEYFTNSGWIDLRNRVGQISAAGVTIRLIGVDDPHINKDRYPGITTSEELTIGLTHAPYTRVLDAMAGDGVDLALAGHTHGGQVCVPGYGALVTNCDLDTDHVSGVFTWPLSGGAMTVAVSRGLGTSPFAPVRLACRPEVQVLDLVSVTNSSE